MLGALKAWAGVNVGIAHWNKAIESFCCHEKALEYDEYDALLKEAEAQGGKCWQYMQILSRTCCQSLSLSWG